MFPEKTCKQIYYYLVTDTLACLCLCRSQGRPMRCRFARLSVVTVREKDL